MDTQVTYSKQQQLLGKIKHATLKNTTATNTTQTLLITEQSVSFEQT